MKKINERMQGVLMWLLLLAILLLNLFVALGNRELYSRVKRLETNPELQAKQR